MGLLNWYTFVESEEVFVFLRETIVELVHIPFVAVGHVKDGPRQLTKRTERNVVEERNRQSNLCIRNELRVSQHNLSQETNQGQTPKRHKQLT